MTAPVFRGYRCRISLLTEADGKKSVLSKCGTLQTDDCGGVILSYESADDAGSFFTDGKRASWRRNGELSALFLFEEGNITKGTFGPDGLNGEVRIKTHKIALKQQKDVVSAEVVYTLVFDYGEQKMKVKLCARLLE